MHADRHTSRGVYTMFWTLTFDKVAKGDLMQKAILYAYILGTIVPLSQ